MLIIYTLQLNSDISMPYPCIYLLHIQAEMPDKFAEMPDKFAEAIFRRGWSHDIEGPNSVHKSVAFFALYFQSMFFPRYACVPAI